MIVAVGFRLFVDFIYPESGLCIQKVPAAAWVPGGRKIGERLSFCPGA